MSDNIPEILPDTWRKWTSQANVRGLIGKSIHDLDSYQSGSKSKYDQFLLLRAYWVSVLRENFDGHLRDKWFPQYHKAQESLSDDSYSWLEYLRSFEKNYFDQYPSSYPHLGTFSLVRRFQQVVTNLRSENVSGKAHYFLQSSKESSQRGPQTNPATPTPPNRTRITTNPGNDEPITPLLEALNLEAPPSSSRSRMPPYDAKDASEMAKIEAATGDEQTVNTALILFLEAVTMHFTTKVRWSLVQKSFQVSAKGRKRFEAGVDGVLECRGKTLAIVEAKPFLRVNARATIQVQETAQMACWICSEPSSIRRDFSGEGKQR